jgi:hypothetical protein
MFDDFYAEFDHGCHIPLGLGEHSRQYEADCGGMGCISSWQLGGCDKDIRYVHQPI